MENRLSFFDTDDIDSGLLWKWNVWAKYCICYSLFVVVVVEPSNSNVNDFLTNPKCLHGIKLCDDC